MAETFAKQAAPGFWLLGPILELLELLQLLELLLFRLKLRTILLILGELEHGDHAHYGQPCIETTL